MSKNVIWPVGLKRPSKGSHSERSTQHRDGWFQLMVWTAQGWAGGPKFQTPWVPGCIPADKEFNQAEMMKRS
jgi:hypothetical protein